jgi:predicted amidohydrolase
VNEKTIATIALRDGGFSSFEETLRETAQWVTLAAAQGAHLAVLPETINLLHRNAGSSPLDEFVVDNWQQTTATLCEAATRAKIALVLPLLVRDAGVLANRFYIVSNDGASLGFYQKRVPTPDEEAHGVKAGNSLPIMWDGLRVGGGICIDVYYPHASFDPQIEQGADLFVIPSFTPAGCALDYCAVNYGVPFVLAYSPWSRILDRDGTELAAGGYRSETLRFGFGSPIQLATINFDAVTLFADHNQERILEIERHYGALVRIRFDQANCIFTLESRSADLSVDEVMRQFGLVSRRDYLRQRDPAVGKAKSNSKQL